MAALRIKYYRILIFESLRRLRTLVWTPASKPLPNLKHKNRKFWQEQSMHNHT